MSYEDLQTGAGDLGALHDSLVVARNEGVLDDATCKEFYDAARAARRAAGGLKTLQEITGWSNEALYNAHNDGGRHCFSRLVVDHGPDDVPLFCPADVEAELARIKR